MNDKDLLARLAKFTDYVIRTSCFGELPHSLFSNELDGGEIQEVATQLGILIKIKATKQDVIDSGYDFDEGDTIYKFNPEILKLIDKAIEELSHDQK